jgi:hypothetical protein
VEFGLASQVETVVVVWEVQVVLRVVVEHEDIIQHAQQLNLVFY